MMKRNMILLAILILAGIAVFYVWQNRRDTSSSFERSQSNFKVEDVESIGRIVITDKHGNLSDLKRKENYWTINDVHRARQSSIDHLLKGISTQQLDYIPNLSATEKILQSIAVNGIHVEIFDQSGNKMLGYYVGGVTQDERGTFFLKEGSTQPYTLIQPGFDGGLRARYALRPVDWRDVRFWTENTSAIDTFKVNYPKEKQLSFMIVKDKGSYDVEPLFETTPKKSEEANRVRIESYITTLTQLACANFLPESPEKDSILRSVPFMEIEMAYRDSSSYIRFYPIIKLRKESSTDVPRFYIDYGGKDFMIAQQNVIKGAFRSYDYFFE